MYFKHDLKVCNQMYFFLIAKKRKKCKKKNLCFNRDGTHYPLNCSLVLCQCAMPV